MIEDDPIPAIEEALAQPQSSGRPGVDLTHKRQSLRELLGEVHEIYSVALDDMETRADPNKPKPRLEDNWSNDDPGPLYDYGEDTGAGFGESWDQFYREVYHRRRGNPGRGRTKDLPIEPLHPVYQCVRRWWLDNVDSSGFHPDFPRAHGEGARSDPTQFNASSRLLLMIIQDINHRYTADICANLYDAAKRRRRAVRNKPPSA